MSIYAVAYPFNVAHKLYYIKARKLIYKLYIFVYPFSDTKIMFSVICTLYAAAYFHVSFLFAYGTLILKMVLHGKYMYVIWLYQ